MSGLKVRGKMRPGRVVWVPKPGREEKVRGQKPADPKARPVRAARMLALAHHIERLVEAGELADYAAAARALGLTRARLTQVMSLLLLAPEIQERLLVGDLVVTERSLRAVLRVPEWAEQQRLWDREFA